MDVVVRFLAMGGYAAYVWPAFGLAAAVMTALVWSSLRALRGERRTLEALERTRVNPRRASAETGR
ncbi:MAG: heme exporter protein CcmD [Alphaproteobacteria bacterium]|nr:heme exporter protein CcmD [Alphaproteobacteria bacterium]